MGRLEVLLPDRVYNDIETLVNQGEFVSWDEASEEILELGLQAYDVTSGEEDLVNESYRPGPADADQDPKSTDVNQRDDPRFR